jgi:hypothetical protein
MKCNRGFILGILVMVCTSLILWGGGIYVSAAENDTQSLQVELVWSESDGLRHEIFTSSFKNGVWSEPEMITDDNAGNLHPSIDLDTKGRKWIVWTALEDAGLEIRYTVQDEGQWPEVKKIPTSLSSNIKPSIVIDADNIPWVVWSGNNGGLDDIYYSRFVDGKWEKEQTVHPANDVPDILPFLDLDENQQPTVTWESYKDEDYIKLQSIWNGESWSKPVELAPDDTAGKDADNLLEEISLPDFVTDTRMVFMRVLEEQQDETQGAK